MYLLKKASDASAFPDTLTLEGVAQDITAAFMQNGKEDYLGTYMGLNPIRRADNGCPLMTISFGYNVGKTGNIRASTFYNDTTKTLSADLYIRSMYDSASPYTVSGTTYEGYDSAQGKVTTAFTTSTGWTVPAATAFGTGPTLYLTHDNPLTALQYASYKNTLGASGFSDLTALLPVSYPQGTTGGTLASDYWNKMNAYGAVLPGNERWWHAANERMSTRAAVQMTKAFADCLLEMARYTGPAGAQFLSADLAGLNSDRADLDLLDATIGTYKDAKSVLTAADLGGKRLMAATSFVLPMFPAPFTGGRTQTQIDTGHGAGGIYLSTTDADYQSKTFVAPMRLEFKIKRSDLGVKGSTWQSLKASSITKLLSMFEFNIRKNDGTIVSLNSLAPSADIDKYFSKRISNYDQDALYLTVHVAIVDQPGTSITTSPVVASRADRYEPADPGVNPWPARLATTPRGFFLVDDGAKDAEFASPSAIFVTTTLSPSDSSGGDGGGGTVTSPDTNPTDAVNPTPVVVTPATDGSVNTSVTVPDASDTRRVQYVTVDQDSTAVQALNNIGVSVAVDSTNQHVVFSGTATDIGTFYVPITIVYTDGTTAQGTVTFTINPISNTTNNAIDTSNTKTGWNTTLTGTANNTTITLVVPTNLSASDAANAKDIKVLATGMTVTDVKLVVANGQNGNQRMAGPVTLHVTGTTSDFASAKITGFSYRLGINSYTQALNVTLATDTNVVDKRTANQGGSSSSSSGCDSGLGIAGIAMAATLVARRRKR